MGGGNGAKAAQKRERNAEKNKKSAGSQLKSNEAAKTIKCELCKQSFLGTMRRPALTTHAEVQYNYMHTGWLTYRRINILRSLRVSQTNPFSNHRSNHRRMLSHLCRNKLEIVEVLSIDCC
jgi:hypothetical protein